MWILAIKKRIITLQSTDSERLSNKEDSQGDAWISLRRVNRIDFADKLWAGVGGNRRYLMCQGWRER